MSVDILVASHRKLDSNEQTLLVSLVPRVSIHFESRPEQVELVHFECHASLGEDASDLADDVATFTGGRRVAPGQEAIAFDATRSPVSLAEFLDTRRAGRGWNTEALDVALGRVPRGQMFKLCHGDTGEELGELTVEQARRLDAAVFSDPVANDEEREEYIDEDTLSELRADSDDAFVLWLQALLERHADDEGIVYLRWKPCP